MLTTIFALGTIWFWLLILASIVGITALIENEQNALADLVFVATIIALYKLGCQGSLTSLGSLIYHHWLYGVLAFIGYLIAGTLYSFVKWAIYVSDGKDKIIREKNTFKPEDWTSSKHKAKIIHWGVYWPISGIWTLISNPVVRAFNRIFYKLESFYQKISDKIMKDLIEKRNASKNK